MGQAHWLEKHSPFQEGCPKWFSPPLLGKWKWAGAIAHPKFLKNSVIKVEFGPNVSNYVVFPSQPSQIFVANYTHTNVLPIDGPS